MWWYVVFEKKKLRSGKIPFVKLIYGKIIQHFIESTSDLKL